VIVLDPVNGPAIEAAIARGVRDLVGGNCTVSLMLMGLAGLFRQGWLEWVSTMTYQAASGAGAAALRELVAQMHAVGAAASDLLAAPVDAAALELDRRVTGALRGGGEAMPTKVFGAPLAASLIPWIDAPVEGGQTREEWKGHAEANKILEADPPIPVDGLCVRVSAMRCHSQAVTIKLRRAVPLDEVEAAIASAHEWVEVVPNTKEATLARLSPAAVSGTLAVPVGRIHTLRMGPDYLTAFTVGDQLLWGAAEPLRRVLQMILR
jgi:aspartate-semialdehyde dehydrogenase